jgi:hypothetical protein
VNPEIPDPTGIVGVEKGLGGEWDQVMIGLAAFPINV